MRVGLVAALLVLALGACGADEKGGGSGDGGTGGGNENTGGTGGSGGEGTGGTGGTGGIGGSGGSGGEGGTGGTGGTGGFEPVEWETCYLATGRGECATLKMPLDRDDPESPTIDFFVRRILADGESRGQLWLLEGGPGFNGGQLPLYAEVAFLDLGLDIYMPDYRGVGRSTNLGCGDGEDNFSWGCLRELQDVYGEDLVRFSTSDAVRDVGEAIERLRAAGQEVYVWGTSYGTATAHRYLHLFPGQADGVILDSACGKEGCDIVHAEVDVDRNAQEIAEICRQDEFCRGKLGDDPWAKVAEVLDRVEAGHCADAFGYASPEWARLILGQLLGPMYMPAVGLAMVYRLDRCEPADAEAVGYLVWAFSGYGVRGWTIYDDVVQNDLLYYQIVMNEFWEPEYDEDYIEEISRDLVLDSGTMGAFADLYEAWPLPRYQVPDELRVWADVDVPVLILNGTLDAQTRPERMIDARDAFTAPHQHVVIIPYAYHGTIMPDSDSGMNETMSCGTEITRQFLADPTSNLDVSCVDEQLPPRFESAPYQEYWFGTPDLWENRRSLRAPAVVEIDDPLLRARFARARAELQRQLGR